MTDDELIAAAQAVRHQAYAPYSKFRVGAALLTASDRLFTGCNVENASYGLAICAERAAVCQAIAEGEQAFKRLVIVATPWAAPCGACRQVLIEFGTDLPVISADAKDPQQRREWRLGDLLPDNFRLL